MSEQEISDLVGQAKDLLTQLGIPLGTETLRRQERIAKSFLAVCGIRPGVGWASAKSIDDRHSLRSREVLKYMNEPSRRKYRR